MKIKRKRKEPKDTINDKDVQSWAATQYANGRANSNSNIQQDIINRDAIKQTEVYRKYKTLKAVQEAEEYNRPKYEPNKDIKNIKAFNASAQLVAPLNPYLKAIGTGGDLATAIRYGIDGQYKNATIDAIQAGLQWIPFKTGTWGMLDKAPSFSTGEKLFNNILNLTQKSSDVHTLAEDYETPKKQNGGSIKKYPNGGRQPIVGTPRQYQAYQDSLNAYNEGELSYNHFNSTIKKALAEGLPKAKLKITNTRPNTLYNVWEKPKNENNPYDRGELIRRLNFVPIKSGQAEVIDSPPEELSIWDRLNPFKVNNFTSWEGAISYDRFKKPVQPIVYQPEDRFAGQVMQSSPSNPPANGVGFYRELSKLPRNKEQINQLPKLNQEVSQEQPQLQFNPILFDKSKAFSKPISNQNEPISKEDMNKKDFFDKKTGKPLGRFQNGGSIGKWEILEDLPKAENGYKWSDNKSATKPIMQPQNNVNISQTTGNRNLTSKEIEANRASMGAYNKNRVQEEYNDRKNRIEESIQAQSQPLSLKNLQTQSQSTGDKLSFAMNSKYGNPKDYPTLSGYMQGLDYINPAKMIGDMASGLGSAPQDVNEGNYLKAGLSVGTPLFAGATAGIGTQGIKPFVNNLVNPLAGTGEVINNLGNKYLPNAYKLNPYAFKPNSEAFYRQVGKSAYDDAITKGKVFSNGQEDMLERVPGLNYLDEYNKSIALDKAGKFNLTKPSEAPFVQKGELFFPITRKPTGKGYKGTKYSDAEYLLEGKLPNEAVLPRYQQKYFPTLKESSNVGVIRPEFNELNNFNVYKRDWLKGYKPIEIPKSNFKSEINWSKWNKEIPENTQLMQEYNAIEQTSKANGSWMKNSDGSVFQGTPEQFVQQNSENFKKAFPEGSENVFRGTGENIAELRPNRSTFTANQELASGYAPFNKKSNFLNSESVEGGVHSFYRKNSKNSLELDANNTSWTSVDLSNKRLTKDYFERNIKSQEDQIIKQKEYLSKMKQKPNGSWEAPDGTTYSNDLYKNTVGEGELYLKDLKERYKNIDNLISNPKELEEMKKVLGNTTTTDDIAAYVEKRNLDYVKLKNIEDSGVGDVTIVNHKPGNYLKSAVGNNGMFDMTNPNIYKALVPGAIGLGAASQIDKKQNGGSINEIQKYNPPQVNNELVTQRQYVQGELDNKGYFGYGGSVSYKDFKKKYKDV